MLNNPAELLRNVKLRVTPIRLSVLKLLMSKHQPLSVDDIWDAAQLRMDRVTVYRTVESLARSGLVNQIEFRRGQMLYEVNSLSHHHHHLVCESCETVKDVTIDDEERVLQSVERRHRFKPRSHSLEIFGLCAKCQ